jgi:hypothetical protein
MLHTLMELRHWTKHTSDAEYEMFWLLGRVLPCQKCRMGFADNVRLVPRIHTTAQTFVGSKGLGYALFLIHNMVNVKTNKPEIGWGDCQQIVLANTVMFDILVVPAMFIFLQTMVYACEGPLGDDIAAEDVVKFLDALAKVLVAAENSHCAESAVKLGKSLQYQLSYAKEVGLVRNNLSRILFRSFEATAICSGQVKTLHESTNHLLLSMTPQQHFLSYPSDQISRFRI